MKVAAIFVVAAILVATGSSAEKIYKKWKFSEVSITLEKTRPKNVALPDGTTTLQVRTIGTVVSSEDPNAIEIAKRHYEETKKLIGEKNTSL